MPEDPLHEPAHRAREAKRRVGHGKADAILVLVRTGAVIELGIGDGNVARRKWPVTSENPPRRTRVTSEPSCVCDGITRPGLIQ